MRAIACSLLCLGMGWGARCGAQQPGDLDTTFADQGKLLVPCPPYLSGATAIDGNGRILIAVGRGSIDSLYLLRFDADGEIDSSFAMEGRLNTSLDGLVLSVGQTADGNIVVIGSEQSLLVDSGGAVINEHFVDAALDSLLQSTNWTIQDAQQHAHGVTLLVDTTGGTSFLVRFFADASVDASFGSQGVVQLTSPLTVCIYPQRITLSGSKVGVLWMDSNCNPYPSGYVLWREVYNEDGSPSVLYQTGSSVASAEAIHANVLGTMMSQGQKWGTSWVDKLFFDHGTVTTPSSLYLDDLVDISLGPIGSDAVGNFYVAGTNTVEDGWAIYRYSADGVRDTIFDNDVGPFYGSWPYVQTDFFAGRQALPRNVLSQVDGKLLVSGSTSNGSQPFIAVARYHAIPDPRAKLDLKFFLGGPMDTNTGLMHDSLRTQGLVPLQQPYLDSTFQSVNGVGPGMTSTTVLNETGAEAPVDWVWLELLDAADTATVVATRTGLVRRNGTVTSPINHDPIDFSVGAGSYFLRVRHRNHLGVTLSDPIALSDSVVSVDLSDPATNTFGTDAQMEVNGVRMLWPGDVNHNGLIRYAGAANDRDAVLMAVGGTPPTATTTGYKDADVNMDGIVKYAGAENDRDVILQSIGGAHPTAVRFEQVP